MGANEYLVLRAPGVRASIEGLASRLAEDAGLQQLFIQDPVGVIRKTVFQEQEGIPAAEINRGNRLLFALLSNRSFVEWTQQYEADLLVEAQAATHIDDPTMAMNAYLAVVDRTKIHQDLAAAVARTSDAETIASLTWRPDTMAVRDARWSPDVAVDIETFIYAVAVAAAFAVLVAAVFLVQAPTRDAEAVTRADLQAVANQLSDALRQRAEEVRGTGVLTQLSQRNVGFTR